ncbi:histidine kinase dimerization/phosphoacceptor domain -containing protein [Chitinophaga sp. sic0106]|uniref:histidine kinase dimerization/phosphoacceptor domain -containing protein n=1 Tax=Chitinophaga sp. sic0106 TaxID=2854785 RepID=UPI001C481635|nr:histidine kinase dimerization/phosphoacceptor domain -containing protein [Chitinophaga sp. sic0106]MBV7532323.1 ATP-binding protein [Chitinophaga sp. sic0106]
MCKIAQMIPHYLTLLIKGALSKLAVLILCCILSVLSVSDVAAQNFSELHPQELLPQLKASKPDTNRISLQIKMGKYHLYKPGELKNDLDSALVFFNEALELSIKLREIDWQYKAIGMIGTYYVEAGDKKRFIQSFMDIIAHYHDTGDKQKEATAWHELAKLYENTMTDGEMQDRLEYYQHARSLFLQTNDQINANDALRGIAGIQMRRKQFDIAEKALQEVLTQYKKLGYNKLHFTYEMLQYLEYDRGNYNRSIAYCLKAIENMKVTGDTGWLAHFYGSIAKSYVTTAKFDEALEWQRKAATVKNPDFPDVCGLVQILLKLNRMEEARTVLETVLKQESTITYDQRVYLYRIVALYYTKVNQYDVALLYYKKLLALDLKKNYHSEAVHNPVLLICYTEMADVYQKSGNLEEAGKYFKSAETLIKNSTTPMQPGLLVTLYTNLYKYLLARGNYQAAIKHLERRDQLKDSIFTADKDKQIAELHVQYQTTQKELSIKELNSKQAAQKAQLDKVNLQKNITIGGIILLLLLSGIGYKSYRAKQKTNLQLLAKQQQINRQNTTLQHLLKEKDWLLKEVHHRVKNNLHTVICLLEAQARNLENDALEAVENSQNRIYAMSLIHEKLYQSDDIKTIDMAEYIPELVESLKDSFGVVKQIKFKLNIDPVELTLSQAIPLGLILNEAVTNSIKYAFPGNKHGEISIFMEDDQDQITLQIADDGIGMPAFDKNAEPESMGLRLIQGLSEDIDATINFDVSQGTSITIVFKADALNDLAGVSESREKKEEYA